MSLTPNRVKSFVKRTLLQVPLPVIPSLDALQEFARFRRWTHANLRDRMHFTDRPQLYRYLCENIVGDVPIDYLEFGVYKGVTMGMWTALNTRPESRFVGFDSFQGLPEDWAGLTFRVRRGEFDVGGAVPESSDSRVRFVKGWFQDSLPVFLHEFAPKNRLVLHCDADLYSSTVFVLTQLSSLLVPNSIVIFDEFDGVTHEFRAFNDFISAYRKHLTPLASAGQFHNHVAFLVEA